MSDTMTLDEVAREHRISPATLRYWRHRDEGPKSFKIGRRVMYRRTDVEAWVQAQYDATSTKATA